MKVALPESFSEVQLSRRGFNRLDEGCVENGMLSFNQNSVAAMRDCLPNVRHGVT